MPGVRGGIALTNTENVMNAEQIYAQTRGAYEPMCANCVLHWNIGTCWMLPVNGFCLYFCQLFVCLARYEERGAGTAACVFLKRRNINFRFKIYS